MLEFIEPQKNYFGKVLVDSPQLNYSTMYNYYPRSGSVYLQEKLEVQKDGAVVNLGFRWDFRDPRSQRPIVEYTEPDTAGGAYEGNLTGYTDASLKQQISPRMALSFPMMWNLVLMMNYGHYFQFPLFDYLYSGINPQQLAQGINVLVGNPDLKPERTHAWEIGIKYGLDERTLLSATYFKKEFIDQIDSKTARRSAGPSAPPPRRGSGARPSSSGTGRWSSPPPPTAPTGWGRCCGATGRSRARSWSAAGAWCARAALSARCWWTRGSSPRGSSTRP